MFRRTAFVSVPALAFLLLAALAARAADDPLKIIPGNALGWGVINHLADGDGKIQKLAGVVGAPQISLLEMVKDKLGVKDGLDAKGAMGVIALPPKDKEDAHAPSFVVFVAVTDYKTLLGNFEGEKKDAKIAQVQIAGQTVAVAKLGGFALFAKSDDQEALESVLASKQSIASDTKPMAAWLAGNDVNIIATKSGIKLFTAQGKVALKQLGETLSTMGQQGASIKSALQIYATLLDAVEKNVSLGAVGLHVDKTGAVRLAVRARIVEGGDLATALADVKPASGNLLAGVPGGSFVFAFGGSLQESLMRPLASLGVEIMKKSPELYGLDADQAEKLAKISLQQFHSMREMSMVMKLGRAGEPIYSNVYIAFRVDDADKYLAAYEKQIEAMKDLLKDAKEGAFKPPVSKKIEIDGKPAFEVEVTIPVPKTEGNPMAEKMMQAMFGPDNKMTMYITKADEKTVYMTLGASQDKLQRAIAWSKDEKKCLAADTDVAATVAMLPAGAQGIVLVSPRGYMGMVQRMMESMLGENGPAASIPAFPKCPPVGIAIQAAPGELSLDVVVPAGMIKAAGEYAGTMRERMMGGPMPQVP